jgi:hypothetical protein
VFIKLVGFQKLLVDFSLKKVSFISPTHHELKMGLWCTQQIQPHPLDLCKE